MPRRRVPIGRRILLSAALVGASSLVTLGSAPVANAAPDSRQDVYAAAAAEFGIPESVLLGVSYLESRWDVNGGGPSTSGGFGPMHLTDAEYVSSLAPFGHHDGDEDPRGDESRPLQPVEEAAPAPPAAAALQTLDTVATLTGTSEEALRSNPVANIRGGAALLAAYQKELSAPTGTGSDPAAWYGAVARYSGAETVDAAAAFANEVFSVIAEGASRVTDDGHQVTLPAAEVTPQRSWLDKLGLARTERPDGVECPVDISCEWIPAPYQQYGPRPGD
ncbi:MAG TPA: N-acetylmuramoyl-L-alanine amidase, partial [Micromonosporaceae bacterium]|nr:N-acetylmuramoyl-L-alanine amidase [Micromonosporaceae bacterium]